MLINHTTMERKKRKEGDEKNLLFIHERDERKE